MEEKTKLVIPKNLIYWILFFFAVVLPFALGLTIARDGVVKNEVFYSSMDIFRFIKFNNLQFFLIGYLSAILFFVISILAIMYHKTILKWLSLIFVIPLQFICGIAYTMQNFSLHTYVVYGKQSWKVNAINVGIFTALFTLFVYLIIFIIFLIVKRKTGYFQFLTSKIGILVLLCIMYICAFFVVYSPIMSIYKAVQ
ncbi:MAG: hypothetical protein LBM13_02445 [Candidatus Ancillula sp.]|nr:hypothetical protein [Candidatus Ancillula sp.]